MEDKTPRKTYGYQIGQSIDLLSVEEIEEVIGSLTAEIARLEAAKDSKRIPSSGCRVSFWRIKGIIFHYKTKH